MNGQKRSRDTSGELSPSPAVRPRSSTDHPTIASPSFSSGALSRTFTEAIECIKLMKQKDDELQKRESSLDERQKSLDDRESRLKCEIENFNKKLKKSHDDFARCMLDKLKAHEKTLRERELLIDSETKMLNDCAKAFIQKFNGRHTAMTKNREEQTLRINHFQQQLSKQPPMLSLAQLNNTEGSSHVEALPITATKALPSALIPSDSSSASPGPSNALNSSHNTEPVNQSANGSAVALSHVSINPAEPRVTEKKETRECDPSRSTASFKSNASSEAIPSDHVNINSQKLHTTTDSQSDIDIDKFLDQLL